MSHPLRFTFSFFGVAMLAAPIIASAHETQVFRIGDEEYQIVIGSMNEPVSVDDKSGVEFTITHPETQAAMDESQPHEHQTTGAITGLEQTLKVEVSAGDKKKTFDLTPAWGEAGSYYAAFYPTVQTTFTYRLIGEINDVPVDLSFTCNPAGHPATAEDTSEVNMGENVTRILKRGAFGCPKAKTDLGFPEPAPTLYELQRSNGGIDHGTVGMALGAAALALSVLALRKKR